MISGWLLKMSRGIDAKIHGLLRNILISPLEGEKKFLSELYELRNFREGYNLKLSCRHSNADLQLHSEMVQKNKNKDCGTESAMTDFGKNSIILFSGMLRSCFGRSALLCRQGKNNYNKLVQHKTELKRFEPSPAFVMLTGVRKRLLPLTKREGSDSVITDNLTDTNYSLISETVFSRFTSHFSYKCTAFTLVEVLITLGIIGIVATMTLPVLIEQHEKKVTAVKLEKFYTIMSQAVLRWRTEEDITDDFLFPDEIVRNDEKSKIWYTNNLQPYINSGIYDKKYYENRYFSVRFNDGSGFVAYVSSPDVMYIFYCTKFKYCAQEHYDGRRTFLFSLYHGNFYTSHPEQSSLDRDFFLEKCKNPSDGNSIHRHYCTRLIQYDGWEIKPDYPWKIN